MLFFISEYDSAVSEYWIRQRSFWIWRNSFWIRRLSFLNPTSSFWIGHPVSKYDELFLKTYFLNTVEFLNTTLIHLHEHIIFSSNPRCMQGSIPGMTRFSRITFSHQASGLGAAQKKRVGSQLRLSREVPPTKEPNKRNRNLCKNTLSSWHVSDVGCLKLKVR